MDRKHILNVASGHFLAMQAMTSSFHDFPWVNSLPQFPVVPKK